MLARSSALASAVCSLAPLAAAQGAGGSLVVPVNTGTFDFSGDLIALDVPEQDVDWNGDGDTDDDVVHVFDLSTGVLTNLATTAYTHPDLLRVAGDCVVFLAREPVQLVDWNGDGDMKDRVLHVYDASTGVLENTGVAGAEFETSDERVVLSAREAKQGETDLNGDGDATDSVLFTLDVTADGAQLTNSQLATWGHRVSGDRIVVDVGEAVQGQDLNGDGDLTDRFLHFADGGPFVDSGVSGSLVASFFTEGLFLFGSGASSDQLTAFHFGTGTVLDLGTTFETGQSVPGWAAVLQDELLEGVDANGDGAFDGRFLRIVDTATYEQKVVPALVADFEYTLGDGGAGFAVLETDTDLNGNGQLGDKVAHAFLFETGEVVNLAGGLLDVGGSTVAYTRKEGFDGVDLNGDGDTFDRIVHTFDLHTGQTHVYPLAASFIAVPSKLPLHVFGEYVAARVSENSQGQQDLNGDGDAVDHVLHLLRPSEGTYRNTRLVVDDTDEDDIRFSGTRAVVSVEEEDLGVDVTGDGELEGKVLVVLELGAN